MRGGDRGLAGSLGYGLRAFGGMLTPYTERRFTSGNAGSIRQVAGVRFSDSEALEFSLLSECHPAEAGTSPAGGGVRHRQSASPGRWAVNLPMSEKHRQAR
ncbi:MAG: hypothetical protein ISN29_09495 [Gammaproteobacteria bacterium AqS3]|nr:hypothetical protein [Gammaproteobacteria bacterium AqS3]